MNIVRKINNYLSEAKDVDKYRKIVLDWFNKAGKTKANTKKMRDMMWMINIFQKKGKIKVDYRDNTSGNVVPYIGSTAVSSNSIGTAQDIGLEGIFKL